MAGSRLVALAPLLLAAECLPFLDPPGDGPPSDTDDVDSELDSDSGAPDADLDGDGFLAPPQGADCDDEDPSVHPRATERCDLVDHDCDGITHAPGMVSLVGPLGRVTRLDEAVAAASASAPLWIELGEGERLELCEGHHHAAVYADSGVPEVVGLGEVVLDASGVETGIWVGDAAGLVLRGVTVLGGGGVPFDDEGRSAGGAALVLFGEAPVRFEEVRLVGGRATWGGGLFVGGGRAVTLVGGSIEGGVAQDGGGVFVSGGASIELSGTVISGNEAESGGGVLVAPGGVVGSADGTATVSGNAATWGGGAVLWDDATWRGVAITDNVASGGGGGVYVGGPVQIAALVARNEAPFGGGLFVPSEAGVARLGGSELAENRAELGAGVYVGDASRVEGPALVRDNVAPADGYGGGAFGWGDVSLHALTLRGNTAGSGGGVALHDGWVGLTDVVVDGNRAPFDAGLFIGPSATASMTGGAVVANVAGPGEAATTMYNTTRVGLTFLRVDWGSGERDNQPADIGLWATGGSAAFDAPRGALAWCDANGCTAP